MGPGPLQRRLDSVTVCTAGDVSGLPQPEPPAGVTIEQIDHDDAADVSRWLAVHAAAYGPGWSAQDFRERVVDHPWFAIRRTYLAVDEVGPVGTASIGVFRRAPQVGIGHYLGVDPRARGRGVGAALLRHRYASLRHDGVTACESHTHLGRIDALRSHFACGFVPKVRLDHWNPPHPSPWWLQAAANRRLVGLHRRWVNERSGRAPR